MMIVLDTCNWGIEGVDELPPHYHYVAGLVEMPDGRKEWLPGAIGNNECPCEQREFISMDLRIDRTDLIALIEKLWVRHLRSARPTPPLSPATERKY